MSKPIQDMTSWATTGSVPLDTGSPASTHASTHASSMSGLSQRHGEWPSTPTDVGRRIAETQWDMSVVCEAAEALSLQFDVLQPTYIAVHDVGGTISRRLLAGVAAAMQLPVHTLTIRRQGYGNLLARLEFVELAMQDPPGGAQRRVRIYSTQSSDADSSARRQLIDVLLGRAVLGVVIIDSEITQAALAVAFAGLQDAMSRSAWLSRRMLVMPLRPIEALDSLTARLGKGRPIEVEVASPVVRPFDAWNHIRNSWNALAQTVESNVMPLDDPTVPAGRTFNPATRPERSHAGEATAAAVEALRRRLLTGTTSTTQPSAESSPAEARIDAAAKTIAALPRRETQRSTMSPAHTLASRAHAPQELARQNPAPAWSAAPARPATPARPAAPARPAETRTPTVTHASVLGAGTATSNITTSAAALAASRRPLAAQASPAIDDRPTVPVDLSPPVVGEARTPAEDAGTPGPLRRLLTECAAIGGMKCCAVIDLEARKVIAEHDVTDAAAFGGHGTRIANAMRAAALGFQIPGRVPDAAMTYDDHHLLVRPVPGHEKLAFVALLDREEANVVVVRLKLQRIEKAIFSAPPGADAPATAH